MTELRTHPRSKGGAHLNPAHVYVISHVSRDWYWGMIYIGATWDDVSRTYKLKWGSGWRTSIRFAYVYSFERAVFMDRMPHEEGRWYAVGRRIYLDPTL